MYFCCYGVSVHRAMAIDNSTATTGVANLTTKVLEFYFPRYDGVNTEPGLPILV